jgi:hypothetical protein
VRGQQSDGLPTAPTDPPRAPHEGFSLGGEAKARVDMSMARGVSRPSKLESLRLSSFLFPARSSATRMAAPTARSILHQFPFFVGARSVSGGHVRRPNRAKKRHAALLISRIISRNRSASEKGVFDKRLSAFAQNIVAERQKIVGAMGFLTIFCMARPPGVEPGLLG